MILLREINENDLDELEGLSRIAAEKHPGFLNLSYDRDQWREKIQTSIGSFEGKITHRPSTKFIFVAEDLETGRILGVSMTTAQHGTEDSPHFYFQIDVEKRMSDSISTGFLHGTLQLHTDTDGPTEIGGLLVNPDFRNSGEHLGRQISFVRFHFMAMHRALFKDRVLAELLPPLTKRGKSPLWEAVGRRFTNMDYVEADVLSQRDKEFITALFPSQKIYVTLLSAEARNAIGKVSKDTEPVMHMLKKIGFEYLNQVDPFDGGPHLVAQTDKIKPIANTKKYIYSASPNVSAVSNTASQGSAVLGIVSIDGAKPFRAIAVNAQILPAQPGELEGITFDPVRADVIGLNAGTTVVFTPYY